MELESEKGKVGCAGVSDEFPTSSLLQSERSCELKHKVITPQVIFKTSLSFKISDCHCSIAIHFLFYP